MCIDNCRKQLTGISADKFGYCHDGILNELPCVVRHGHLESVIDDQINRLKALHAVHEKLGILE